MHQALNRFRENIQRCRDMGSVVSALAARVTPAVDLSDVFRAQIVFCVSALDHLIHELVEEGMIQVHSGLRSGSDAMEKYQLRYGDIQRGMVVTDSQWLRDAIRRNHGWLSFQSPDKISTVINRIMDKRRFWRGVASRMGEQGGASLKRRLRLIVDRRNKIAHEADLNRVIPGQRWPISAADAIDCVDYIECFGDAVAQTLIDDLPSKT